VNIVHMSDLNHHEFLGLLEETENEHSEVIYHTNVGWLSQASVL